MSAWLTGLPLIGYGMAATYLLRRRGRGIIALVAATDGAVAVAALVALLVALSAGPVTAAAGPVAASPWAPLMGVALAAVAASVAAATAVTAAGPAAATALPARPGLSGRTLLVAGVAEGVAIYGFAVCVLLLGAA